jgi:hypothetical protein
VSTSKVCQYDMPAWSILPFNQNSTLIEM